MSVDTKRVAGRRKLRFESLDDIVADAERLSAGDCRALGNWTLGQCFTHLARGMDLSIDFDETIKPPRIVRWVAPWLKGRLLRKGLSPGFRLPKNAAAKLIPPATDTQEGLDLLRRAVERQHRESRRVPSVVFGPMTREEWDQLHLRHAELHLSFFVPA